MAAQLERAERLTSTLRDDVADLRRVLGRLRLRLGLERLVVFGVRGLIASAVTWIGLLVAAWLLPITTWTGWAWLVAVPLLGALSLAMLRWPSDRQAARAADRRLALDERLATAVELSERLRLRKDGGRFDRLQVLDAVDRARVAPSAWLALDGSVRREAALAAALTVVAGCSLLLPGLPRPGLLVGDQTSAVTDLASVAVQDRAAPAVADLTLGDAQPIQAAQPDPGLATRVQQHQAERAALDTLAQAVGRISAGQPAADAIQRGDFAAARDQLANLGEEADQLSDAAKQQLSRALQQAAGATAATDRQLADRERQAAQALSRTAYADQRQALRNLADQVAKSGARTASADQLARDVGQLQQQAAASQAASLQGQAPGPRSQGTQEQSAAGAPGQQGGPGVGTGSNPDVLGDQPGRLDTAGQRVDVPTKLGTGPGVRPPDGNEDQLGTDPSPRARSVSELVQSQQMGQVAPEQNFVPGEQRPVVRGYFR